MRKRFQEAKLSWPMNEWILFWVPTPQQITGFNEIFFSLHTLTTRFFITFRLFSSLLHCHAIFIFIFTFIAEAVSFLFASLRFRHTVFIRWLASRFRCHFASIVFSHCLLAFWLLIFLFAIIAFAFSAWFLDYASSYFFLLLMPPLRLLAAAASLIASFSNHYAFISFSLLFTFADFHAIFHFRHYLPAIFRHW